MRALHYQPIRRFWLVGRPFFKSELRWRAYGWLGLLLGLLFTVSMLNVLNSYIGRDFMTAISERKADRYPMLAVMYVLVFLTSTIVAVFERFSEERFGLLWRSWLTRHLIDKYLTNQAFYRLNTSQEIDNPDQRISEDVRNFTVTTLGFALMVLNSTITVVAFLGVLWSITPWLFLVAVLYPTIGTLVTIAIGHRLVGLNNLQLKKEADLRFELAHVRQEAAALVLAHEEAREKAFLHQRLGVVVENFRQIIFVNRNLGFFVNFYNYLIQIIPLVIASPLYFRGQVEFGVVTQSAMAFAHVVNAFSLIVIQFQNISAFAAVIGRLGSLWEAIDGTAEGQGAEAGPTPPRLEGRQVPKVPKGPAVGSISESETAIVWSAGAPALSGSIQPVDVRFTDPTVS